jgi:deazaflavin-dependent oxidoreductase (nitroreductase family)
VGEYNRRGALPVVDPTAKPSLAKRIMTPLGRSKAGKWTVRNVSRRVDPILVKLTRGRLSTLVFTPAVLLMHTGAKSGVQRVTTLLYFTDNGRVILMASNFGGAHHPAWYHNVKVHPEVTLYAGGRQGQIKCNVAEQSERPQVLPETPIPVPEDAIEAVVALRDRLNAGKTESRYMVGVGLKQIGGEYTDQIAICVYVPRKTRPDEVPEGEVVPSEFGSYLTDVVESRPILCDDDAPYDPLCGGIQISRDSDDGTLAPRAIWRAQISPAPISNGQRSSYPSSPVFSTTPTQSGRAVFSHRLASVDLRRTTATSP